MIANQVINGDELLAESSVSEKAAASTGQWYLRIMASAEDAGIMPALQNILRQHHGANPVLIVFERDHRKIALNETYWLTADDETGEAIRSILGENNVVFKSIQ